MAELACAFGVNIYLYKEKTIVVGGLNPQSSLWVRMDAGAVFADEARKGTGMSIVTEK